MKGSVTLNLKDIIEKSNLNIEKEKILYKEPMKNHTTFKIGGPAECLIKIDNEEDLEEILKLANENKITINIIGNGSNLLVLDGGIKGITLEIKMEKVEIKKQQEKCIIEVESGIKLGKLAQMLAKEEISGLEELSGIPGTLGGAIIMNAGAHGKEIKDIIKSVNCIDMEGDKKVFSKEEMNFKYRESILKNSKYIVTSAILELQSGKREEIMQKMKQYLEYRKEHQPIEYPSAGSTFKRGEDFITAKLIDEAGLKGYKIGGAEVSTKHAGFIINKGNATAKDILKLVEYIKTTVYDKFNKNIELEIQIMGEE